MHKINVAVLGLGGMGGTHVQAAQASPWVNGITGYEPAPERAAQRGRELGIPATADLAAILRDPGIRLVTIASTNETHCELTCQALRAGKAVLCEKPMGVSLAEARMMRDTARDTGGFLQIGFELRYSQLYRQIKDWIGAGLIGQPLNSHCDYWCSEFHLRDSWRSKSPDSLIGEKLCHYLDLPRWWFGQEVVELHSMASPNFVSYFNHPDNHQIMYRFADGTMSSLMFVMGTAETWGGDPLQDYVAVQADDGHRLTYLIWGSKGAIEADVFRRRIRRWEFTDQPDKLHSRLVETLTYTKETDLEWSHNVHGQNLRVIELVATGQPPDTPAADSCESMKLVFAAEQSERERRGIRLAEV